MEEGSDDEGASGGLPAEAIPQYLDLHSTLPTQAGIEKKTFRVIPPTHAIGETGPITFELPTSSDEQILPCGVRVMVRVRVENLDGSPLVTRHGGAYDIDNVVIPVNGIGHAMFSDIEVRVNDQKIASYDGNYAYRGNLENLLFTSLESKEHSGQLLGFEEPNCWPFDYITTSAGLARVLNFEEQSPSTILEKSTTPFNNGQVWGRRYIRTRDSKIACYIDRLYSELFNQPLALPPGAKLGVQLERSPSKFCLLSLSDKQLKLHIVSCHLIVPFIKTEQSFVQQIEYTNFGGKKMRYPMLRVEISKYTKPAGLFDLSEDNILLGSVTPRRIFVVLVDANAVSGHQRKDPFLYAPHKLSYIGVKIGGQQSSTPAYEMNYEEGDYAQPLFFLQAALGIEEGGNQENGINWQSYPISNCVYGFDMNGLAGVEMSDAFVREVRAPTGLEIKLREASGMPITVIVYKEFDAEMTIAGSVGGDVVLHSHA